jgi:NDP-sugar pyrophosphorylase family protein
MQAVILAAGRGTRLNPLTINRSKAMLPILGKPLVERAMEPIIACGVSEFILVVHPEDLELMEYLKRETHPKRDIRFVYQNERKGMAHALNLARSTIKGDFLLSACDNLVSQEDMEVLLKKFSQNNNSDGLLALLKMHVDEIVHSSMVEVAGDHVLNIKEKPRPDEITSKIGSIPLYVFSPSIFSYLERISPSSRGEFELQDAIQLMVKDKKKVMGQLVNGRLTITTAEDLLSVNLKFFKLEKTSGISQSTFRPDTRLIPPFLIEPGIKIGSNCKIGPNVFIERNCMIGNNVKIQDTVLLRGHQVNDGTALDHAIIG